MVKCYQRGIQLSEEKTVCVFPLELEPCDLIEHQIRLDGPDIEVATQQDWEKLNTSHGERCDIESFSSN